MRSCTIIAVLFCITGCHPLPAGDLTRTAAPPLKRSGDAYLLRGWRDLYSDGIDKLATELEAHGVRATVYRENQWEKLAGALIARYGKAGDTDTLVLVGFSFGADHAIDLARRLNQVGVKVPLLVTIDPVTPPRVPANVAVCLNLYQSNGWTDIFPWFRGVRLKADSDTVQLINIDVHDRPDLDDPAMSHKTIAASAKVHRTIVEQVLNHCPPH